MSEYKDYHSLKSEIESNGYTYLNDIEPEIVDAILEIKNSNKQIELNNKLIEMAEESDELRVALIKANLTNENLKKIYNMLRRHERQVVFLNPHLTIEQIDFLIKDIKPKTVKEYFDSKENCFHNNTLELIAKLDVKTQEKLDFLHLQHIEPSDELEKEIYNILANNKEKWFKGEVPETFTTAIINNPKFSTTTREVAFRNAYNLNNIMDTTEEISKEIYRMCAETLFDISESELDGPILKIQADNKIKHLMLNNILPESCQIDFITRFAGSESFKYDKALLAILENTNSNFVLQKSLELIKSNYYIIQNNPHLSPETFRFLTKYRDGLALKRGFCAMAIRRRVDEDICEDMIKLKNNEINVSLASSFQQSDGLKENILNNTRDEEMKKIIGLIYELKDSFYTLLTRHHAEQITYLTSLYLMKHSNKLSIGYSDLSDALKVSGENKWNRITLKEHKRLNTILQKIKEKYPEYNKTWEYIEKTNNTIYHNEKMFNQFPTIFNDSHPIQQNICFNIENLLKLNEDEMNTLINYIDKSQDGNLLYHLKCEILMHFDEYTILNQDDLFINVYKLCDVYNAIDKRENYLKIEEYRDAKKEDEYVR